jgi:hypothetical protein
MNQAHRNFDCEIWGDLAIIIIDSFGGGNVDGVVRMKCTTVAGEKRKETTVGFVA